MATVYDIPANVLIEKTAQELAKLTNNKPAEWSAFVKTSPGKERVPSRDDWWYVRQAAILRKIYKANGPIGVQKLRIKYGCKKNRGHKPERFYKASGKIIRVMLQQLEQEDLVKKAEAGVHKGRVISPKGRSFLDKIASSIIGKRPRQKIEKPSERKDAEKQKKEEQDGTPEQPPKPDKLPKEKDNAGNPVPEQLKTEKKEEKSKAEPENG